MFVWIYTTRDIFAQIFALYCHNYVTCRLSAQVYIPNGRGIFCRRLSVHDLADLVGRDQQRSRKNSTFGAVQDFARFKRMCLEICKARPAHTGGGGRRARMQQEGKIVRAMGTQFQISSVLGTLVRVNFGLIGIVCSTELHPPAPPPPSVWQDWWPGPATALSNNFNSD